MAKNQADIQEKKELSSSNVVAPSSKKAKFVHTPELKNEAMPVYFPPGLPEMFLNYLAGDVDPTPEDKQTEKNYVAEQPFTLFGRNFSDLMHPQAALVANFILHGEEKDVNEALTLVKKNPNLLRYHTLATDPLGRQVKGTPLQIASIGGDVDLVERLIAEGNLSKEEVANQLECVTSIKAEQLNKKRNQRILVAIKQFGQGIIKIKADNMSFEAYQTCCKPLIDQLEKDLQPDTNEIVKAGYVFDPKILHDAAKWFEGKVDHFGDWWSFQSNVFWIHGFGKLQSRLSSRDAQIIRAGIGYLFEGTIPPRTLCNSDGSSYYFNPNSSLGIDSYLGYYGGLRSGGGHGWPRSVENLCQVKKLALQNLCNVQNNLNEQAQATLVM